MHVLIVRLSSMGDLVHTLPALTDAANVMSDIKFDWAVDETFADVPAWHRNIEEVIICPPRSLSGGLWKSFRKGTLQTFLRKLHHRRYDAVIDMQGEIKTAIVTWLSYGPRYGFHGDSVHEWGGHFAYQKHFSVPQKHSIDRMRDLMAQALGYECPSSEPDYGIDRSKLPTVDLKLPTPYALFIHSTSWESKCWPEFRWIELASKVLGMGFNLVLPWGNPQERERSERIAQGQRNAIVLPDLSISEKASIISRASFTVGSDTGLSHIAAALDIPSVTLYGATDPALIGAKGKHQVHIASGFECVKCHAAKCTYPKASEFKPACFVEITVDRVWERVESLLGTYNLKSKISI
ncbi:MAG: lipopolysaccharide heptosyltransferase I [Acidobacteria bacterium]|nr:MAG: lipopolysaccharide heptosyltransferase I [Acidobacteriota bacterium]